MARKCCRYFTASLVPMTALILAIVFALGIVVLPILYVHLTKNTKYGIVIDAGSSHTTMHFYKWHLPKRHGTADIKAVHSCPTYRTLSSYSTDPGQVGEVFSECINNSHKQQYIHKSEWSNTNLYLGATAGMRLVQRNDSSISEAIMKNARAELSQNSGYNFKLGRILTGTEEATAGWIAANFALKALMKSEEPLMGSLDLGGASAEIAFLHHSESDSNYSVSVDLFGESYSIYSRSYLCFGEIEAKWRFLAYLINRRGQSMNTTDRDIPNPCMQYDARVNYSQEAIFSSVCVQEDTSRDIFGFGYSPPTRDRDNISTNYSFVGTGEPEKCSGIISTVFNVTSCSDSSLCRHSHFLWPPVNNSGTFLGMSGFFYTAEFFNFTQEELTSLHNFSESVKTFCRQNHSQLASVSAKYEDKYQKERCFDGLFSLFLLKTGFGFNSSTSNWTLKFVEKVHSVSISWATGYMLDQSKAISDNPHRVERPYTAVDLTVGILVLTILCSVFVLFFLLTFNACLKVIKTHSGYFQIS